MLHQMNLRNNPFLAIKNNGKTIEMRLYDEKRRMVKVDDKIIFTNIDTDEKIMCTVINIYIYKSFIELYKHHDKLSIGYKINEEPNPNDMLLYYSQEKIDKYGVVAIEIKLDNLKEIN